jgi:hypothetical protein
VSQRQNGVGAFALQDDFEGSIVYRRNRPDKAVDFRTQLASIVPHPT